MRAAKGQGVPYTRPIIGVTMCHEPGWMRDFQLDGSRGERQQQPE